MASVLGVDFSTKALDLCLLDEDDAGARWDRIPLPRCFSKIELARAVADAWPGRSWLDHHGVYLVALEEPMGQHRQAIAGLYTVLGALSAQLPDDVTAWLLKPAEWKKAIGLPGNLPTSKGSERLQAWAIEHGGESDWSTDAYAALGIATAAREMNARAVALAARSAA